MKRILCHAFCSFLTLAIAQTAFASPTAADFVAQGRQALIKQTPAGIDEAVAAFKSAVEADPTDAEANFLNAAALLIQEASSSEFQKQFTDIGVTINDPNLYTLTYSFTSGYRGVLQPEANATTDAHLAYLNSKAGLIDQVLASLDKITDPNFKLTLTAAETSLLETKIDYADVCLLRAGAHLAKAATALGNSYSLSAQYRRIYDLFVAGKLNPENVMREFPLLLTFSASPGQRASAKTSLKAAYGEWQKAYPLLAGRDFAGPAENLFSFVSKEYVDELNEVYFVNLNSSLDAPVEMPLLNPFGYFPDKTSLNLSPFFSTISHPRSYFPTSYDRGYFRPGTWADPTFGGIFPQGTQGYANDFGVAGWLVQPTIVEPYEFRLLVGNPEKWGFWDEDQATPLFRSINGIAVDNDGNLYVADSENHVIRKITQDDNVITVVGTERFRDEISSLFVEGASGNWRLPPGVLQWMGPMTVSKNGTIYFFNENQLWSQSPEGVLKAVAGANGNSKGMDGVGGEASSYDPGAMTVSPDGSILVCDGNAIRKVDSTGRVSTIAGEVNWVDDYVNGPSADARFNSPNGIVVASDGTIFVSEEHNGCIRRISTNGTVDTFVGYGPLGELGWWFYRDARGGEARLNPVRLAIDNEDNLYFEDAGTIRKVAPDRMVTTIGGLWGETGFREGVGETARIPSFGSGLAVDRRGTVYIAYNNFVVTADSVLNPRIGNPFPDAVAIPEQTNKPEIEATPKEDSQLFSLRFDTLNVDLSNGPVELPFRAITSGTLRNLNFYFRHPSSSSSLHGYAYGGSIFSPGSLEIPIYATAGLWSLGGVSYTDLGGLNWSELTTEQISALGNVTFTVSNSVIDNTAPVVHSIELLSKEANTSNSSTKIRYRVKISDDISGFSYLYLIFNSTQSPGYINTAELYEWESLVAVEGNLKTYEGTLHIHQDIPQGDWVLQSLEVRDKAGNYESVTLTSLFQSIKYTVSASAINQLYPPIDQFSPNPTSLFFDKTSVNVSSVDQKVKIQISINNDNLPSSKPYINIDLTSEKNENGITNSISASNFELVSGTSANGIFEGELIIPKYFKNGNYTVSSLSIDDYNTMEDSQGYYRYGDSIPAELRKTITVTGAQDVTAPLLQSIEVSPTLADTRNSPVSVTANLTITDDLIGLEDKDEWTAVGELLLRSPSGREFAWSKFNWGNRISGNSLSGTYQVEFKLPQYSEEGSWTVDYIELIDRNYNARFLIPANLTEQQIVSSTIQVQGWPRGWEQSPLDEVEERNRAEAVITDKSAKFWFPVENIERNWTWGTALDNALEYDWSVRFSGKSEYSFSFSKWKFEDETANSGNFADLLKAGQVDVWKEGEDSWSTIEGAAIRASRDGERLLIELTDPELLSELQYARPSYLPLVSNDSSGSSYKRDVKVEYLTSDAQIALSNLAHVADGTEKVPSITTTPSDLEKHVTLTYDGVTTAPTEAGSYTVVAYMNHPNYKGREVATMSIASNGSGDSGSGDSGSGDSGSGDSGSGDSGSGDSGSGDSGSGGSGSGDSGSGDSGSGDSGSGDSGSGDSGSGDSGSGDSGSGDSGSGDSGSGDSGSGDSGSGDSGSGGSGSGGSGSGGSGSGGSGSGGSGSGASGSGGSGSGNSGSGGSGGGGAPSGGGGSSSEVKKSNKGKSKSSASKKSEKSSGSKKSSGGSAKKAKKSGNSSAKKSSGSSKSSSKKSSGGSAKKAKKSGNSSAKKSSGSSKKSEKKSKKSSSKSSKKKSKG